MLETKIHSARNLAGPLLRHVVRQYMVVGKSIGCPSSTPARYTITSNVPLMLWGKFTRETEDSVGCDQQSNNFINIIVLNLSIMSYVRRITLFKIPSESDIEAVLKAYDVLKQTNKKVMIPIPSLSRLLYEHYQDGKRYILSCDANRVYNHSEERSQGYTVAVQSTFASKEDVDYYDKECEAHKELKKVSTPAHKGLCTLLMESKNADEFGQVKL